MLVKLTNNQISRYWNDIKAHLAYTLSPHMETSGEAFNKVLENLLLDKSQAWVIAGEGEDVATIYAMIITTFTLEETTDTKNLLIYSLSGYHFIPDNLWKDGMNKIMAYARGNKCFKVITYTKVKRIIDVAKSLGADTSVTLISWEVKS